MSANRLSVIALPILLAAVLAAGLGCAGHRPKPPLTSAEFNGAPCWVTKGGNCFLKDSEKSKVITGVGSVGGTKNADLAREAALGRARTDIARSLQVRVLSMLKDYQGTTTGGAEFGTAAADEQHIVDVSKQITDLTLSGTVLADSWVSRTGTTHVLARLDVENFKSALSGMNSLSETIRQAVSQRADRAFEELDREVEAHSPTK